MKQKNNTALEATQLELGKPVKGDEFYIYTRLFKIKLQLRHLWAKHIVMINNELLEMQEIDTSADASLEMFDKSPNYKNICNSIAIATLFYSWKIFLFKRIVSNMIMRAEPENIQQLWDRVVLKSDPERFFFIMASAQKMIKFKSRNETKSREETAGSEQKQ